MTRLVPLICAAIVAASAAVARPAAAEEVARTLEVELREGGQLVAQPTVTVELGRPASIAVGDYSLRFRMDRPAGETSYVIRSSLYRTDGDWTRVNPPPITVAEGQRARARFAGSDGADLMLAVTVR